MAGVWENIDAAEAEARLSTLYERMSQLESILEGQAQILQKDPTSFAFKLMYNSFVFEQKRLQTELKELLLHRVHEQIGCHLNGPDFEHGTAQFDTLAAFLRFSQKLFSSIAHAITKGPTRRGRIPQEIIQLTQLKLTATSPGSFQLKIAIPSKLDLLRESPVIETLNKMFDLLNTGSEEDDLLNIAGLLGSRAMSQYRLLMRELVATETVPVLEWRTPTGQQKIWRPTYVSVSNTLQKLVNLVEKNIENKSIRGQLVGASLLRNTFEFISEDSKEIIRGNITKEALRTTSEFFGKRCEIVYSETTIVDSIAGIERKSFTLSEIREIP